MVQEEILIPVNFSDKYGYSVESGMSVTQSTTTGIFANREMTYKHVEIKITESDPNPFRDSCTIDLSPLRALALVKRLLACLDDMSREGVKLPQLHSRLMDEYNKTLDVFLLDEEYAEFARSYTESIIVKDGEELRNILPPSIR